MKLATVNDSLGLPTPMNPVPVLPESAPFSLEQRAWLNGFLAGLYSRPPSPGNGGKSSAGPAQRLQPLRIVFGSQTGNAESLAKRAAKAAGQRGFAPTVCDLAQYDLNGLAQEQNLLVITSTYGEGDPPDHAKAFWQFLSGPAAPALPQLRFSVCALGDSNYERFCQCGKNVDQRLHELRATRVFPRADCDVDFDPPFVQWLDGALRALSDAGESASLPAPQTRPQAETPVTEAAAPAWSRACPFAARLMVNRNLNGAGSAKETRHVEISLEGSGLSYEPGDALGVMPANDSALVDEVIAALGASAEASVRRPDGDEVSLRKALLEHHDIKRISKPMLAWFAERTADAALLKLTDPDINGELDKFLWGREVIDLLAAYPQAKPGPAEFTGLLKRLQPRLYSIASSPKAHPGQVHLTVAVVRYQSLGRLRRGVCSSFFAERVPPGGAAPVFVQPNQNFRLPGDGARPIIMVGPGTGIAPFRAFLHERQASGASGRNWLFFGDQREGTDFLYRDELFALKQAGILTRLDTAFSRDQKAKIYVQHRLLENAKEVFDWLEAGAHFYVCGDASRMAKDVDAALHQVITRAGGRSPEQAAEYVEHLRAERRYHRDVY